MIKTITERERARPAAAARRVTGGTTAKRQGPARTRGGTTATVQGTARTRAAVRRKETIAQLRTEPRLRSGQPAPGSARQDPLRSQPRRRPAPARGVSAGKPKFEAVRRGPTPDGAPGLQRLRQQRLLPQGLPRAPFAVLVLSLLGGGLVCLLAINTTLGATSFQITRLQSAVNAKALQVQTMEQQIASDEAPAQIEQEAYTLGMRTQQELEFLDLRAHQVYGQPAGKHHAAAAGPAR